MLHSLGTDGTLKSTTLEGRLRELISRMSEIEKDRDIKNKNGADCIISSSGNAEAEQFTGRCQCYLMVADSNSITYPEVYTAAPYTQSTGSEAVNFNHSLAEVVLEVWKAEGSSVNNPNQLERRLVTGVAIAFNETTLNTPATYNAILSFDYDIPTVTITNADGTTTTTAKEYLVNGAVQ